MCLTTILVLSTHVSKHHNHKLNPQNTQSIHKERLKMEYNKTMYESYTKLTGLKAPLKHLLYRSLFFSFFFFLQKNENDWATKVEQKRRQFSYVLKKCDEIQLEIFVATDWEDKKLVQHCSKHHDLSCKSAAVTWECYGGSWSRTN